MSILLMMLLISALVLAHEWGHFWVAKRCGVKVERFGLGLPIGEPFYCKKWGDTEYCLHWLPLGGYVAFPDDSPESQVPADSIERFENQPILNRAAIALAGITVNALVAFALMSALIFFTGAPQYKAQVLALFPDATLTTQPAEVEIGSSLAPSVVYNGQPVSLYSSPTDLMLRLKQWTFLAPQSQLVLKALVRPEGKMALQQLVLQPSAGANAGLQVGDSIISINGQTGEHEYFMRSWGFVPSRIKPLAGQPVDLTVESATGKQKTLTIIPNSQGYLGVVLNRIPQTITGFSPWLAFTTANQMLWDVVGENFSALGRLVVGQLDPKMLSGPIGIVTQGAKAIDYGGLGDGLKLTAIISMILAVMNLLPIPPLDGSHLVFLLLEALKGKPVCKKTQERIVGVGYAGLMLLMVFVVGNDLVNTFFVR